MFPYPVSRSRMGDICSHDHNRNFKHMVDTSKLGVELEAEVGKTLEEDAYKYIDTIVRRDCAYLHVHLAIRFEDVPLNAALGGEPELEVTHLLHSVIDMASLER